MQEEKRRQSLLPIKRKNRVLAVPFHAAVNEVKI